MKSYIPAILAATILFSGCSSKPQEIEIASINLKETKSEKVSVINLDSLAKCPKNTEITSEKITNNIGYTDAIIQEFDEKGNIKKVETKNGNIEVGHTTVLEGCLSGKNVILTKKVSNKEFIK